METINQKLNRLANESMQELIEIGFEEELKNNNISFTLSNAKKRLGQCECGGKDFIVKDLKTNKIIVGEE